MDTHEDLTHRARMQAKAFNAGADARLRGEPLCENPYHSDDLRRQWHNGWLDVHEHWGDWSRRRVSELPELPDVRGRMEGESCESA